MGVNATLKVPVPAQDSHGNQVSLLYRRDNRLREWSAVADARHAPVADEMETVEREREGDKNRKRGREKWKEKDKWEDHIRMAKAESNCVIVRLTTGGLPELLQVGNDPALLQVVGDDP